MAMHANTCFYVTAGQACLFLINPPVLSCFRCPKTHICVTRGHNCGRPRKFRGACSAWGGA
eukprot:2765-Lingulodinium_polyedra.AAC.1